jgi:hypothetical protein
MDTTEQSWLKNRVHAAVDDDFYLDRDEEKRIKEEGASRNIEIRDIELVIRTQLQELGAVSERQLLDDLERMLHQFTDDDKLLDRKEERDAFDKVVLPAIGKKKGLDPRVAEDYVESFCRVSGVRRQSTANKSWGLLPIIPAFLIVAIAIFYLYYRQSSQTNASITGSSASLTDRDRGEIDQHLSRARDYVSRAQYTEPPERSAKAELDAVRLIDPASGYRSADVQGLGHQIVQHYFSLADRSIRQHNLEAARQWIGRARLMNVDAEEISQKERDLGLVTPGN